MRITPRNRRSAPIMVAWLLLSACVSTDLRADIGEGSLVDTAGPPPLVPADTGITQSTQPLALILAVDNSCSMLQHQERLAQGLLSLGDPGIPWRAVVITTDMDVVYEGSDALELSASVLAGTSGHSNERGLDAVALALGLVQGEAPRVLVLSDEEDHSSADPSEIAALGVVVHALVGTSHACPHTIEVGERYMEAATLTGGVSWDLCGSIGEALSAWANQGP